MFPSLLSIPLLASLLSITTQSHLVSAAPAHWNQTLEARQGVNTGFPYGSEKVRGVNLGGWLLLGKPISPPSLLSDLFFFFLRAIFLGDDEETNIYYLLRSSISN